MKKLQCFLLPTTGKLKKQDGFTLIELLVSINLAFLVFVMVLSVYILMYKFIFTTVRKMEEKEVLFSIIEKLQSSVQQKSFTLTMENAEVVRLDFADADVFYFSKDSIKAVNYLALKGLDNTALQIKPRDEKLLTAFGSSGKEKNTSLQKSSYESPDLAYILLQLSIKNKKYAFRLEIPEMTASNFRNLKGED